MESKSERGNWNRTQKQKEKQQCDICEEIVTEARGEFSDINSSNCNAPYSKALKIMGYSHPKDPRHEKLVAEVIEMIVEHLSKSLNPGKSLISPPIRSHFIFIQNFKFSFGHRLK